MNYYHLLVNFMISLKIKINKVYIHLKIIYNNKIMNEITIKTGTKEEILKYLRSKVTKTINIIPPESFGNGATWSESPVAGDCIEFSYNTIENQMNECILSGSPIFNISLMVYSGNSIREQFIITDYADIKADMEIERLDNDSENKSNFIAAIKQVVTMELEAEDRWSRILSIFNEYKNKNITFAELDNGTEFTMFDDIPVTFEKPKNLLKFALTPATKLNE